MYHNIIDNNNKISNISDKEIKLKKNDVIVSRTDIEGNILYYNNSFLKVTGYSHKELLNMPHSILRHPDMPKAIFFIIWKTILSGRSTYAVIKNLTKEGNFFWVLSKITVQKDNQNNIISFISRGEQAPQYLVDALLPLYKELSKREKYSNIEESIKYLTTFLTQNNYATYDDYIYNLLKRKKRGFFSNLIF